MSPQFYCFMFTVECGCVQSTSGTTSEKMLVGSWSHVNFSSVDERSTFMQFENEHGNMLQLFRKKGSY